MAEQIDFGKLTIKELLVQALGEKDADFLILKIQEGIKMNLQGEELQNYINKAMCGLKFHDEMIAFKVTQITPQITDIIRQITNHGTLR